jgi:hypothetical protein
MYKILNGDSLPELETLVNKYLKKGWEAQGGVIKFDKSWYSQAIVKNQPIKRS